MTCEYCEEGDTRSIDELGRITHDVFPLPCGNVGNVSDGYHTFAELYEHRHALYMLAASLLDAEDRRLGEIRRCWKAKTHHDGTTYPGWFLAGITDPRIRPISYHLPLDWWGKIPGTEIEKAPPYDGHTSQQVAVRVQGLGILLQHVASVNP